MKKMVLLATMLLCLSFTGAFAQSRCSKECNGTCVAVCKKDTSVCKATCANMKDCKGACQKACCKKDAAACKETCPNRKECKGSCPAACSKKDCPAAKSTCPNMKECDKACVVSTDKKTKR